MTLDSRLSTILEFLEACPSQHPKCLHSVHDSAALPSRFVDVGGFGGNVEPRLVASNKISKAERYTTLSHCWGTSPENMPLRTTRSNQSAHESLIPMATLPKTFRDAITVTRALSIRYIWIDSLCIIQDDLKDWEQEAARMASIYEGSFLTIAAVDSPNSNGGLYIDSIASAMHFKFMSSSNSTTASTQLTAHVRHLPRPRSKHDKLHLYNAPLYRRGWVFQEMMLSSRSLHFREHQIYWRCASGLRSEDGTLDEIGEKHGHLNLFDSTFRGQDEFETPSQAIGTWRTWIEYYTSRKLTRPTDRSAAIAGMIRHFQRRTGDTPMLGMWKNSFFGDLNWSTYLGVPLNKPTGPSWSWLSYPESKINSIHGWFSRESNISEPQLESFDVVWSGSPFTSKLVSSRLILSGVVKIFRVTKDTRYRGSSRFCVQGSSGEINCTLDDDSRLLHGLSIACLYLFHNFDHWEHEYFDSEIVGEARRTEYFLIITPQDASNSSTLTIGADPQPQNVVPGKYRRLGVGYLERDIIHKDEWNKEKFGAYNSTGGPNPRLTFAGSERVTIELI